MDINVTNKINFLTVLLFLFMVVDVSGQTPSKYIVTDQFGYLPTSKKVAVIRDPQVGFDAAESFTPGATYALVNKTTKEQVLTAKPVSWKGGTTDVSSGDKAWWFDFSTVTTPGTYYVLDVEKNVKSFDFEISQSAYNGVLRHAMRYFYYQRASTTKEAKYAGAGWADGASHTGPLQDKNARPYNEKSNAAKEMDLSGGWYDAGDFHRYTNWEANYVVEFLRAYIEAPTVWTDDFNIPESGNGIPDVLDEAKWGVDHLLKMQKSDGSVLTIINVDHASPPSSAKGQSVYGTPSTSATFNTGAAFALASKVFGGQGMTTYATKLKESAIKAWDWAVANPAVIFKNNDAASGTAGIGGGQQETDEYGLFMAKMEAACFLYDITSDTKYKDFVEANYTKVHIIDWTWNSLFEVANNDVLLHYTTLPGADVTIVNKIKSTYKSTLNTNDFFLAQSNSTDPYQSYISFYGWGTNSAKSLQGLIFTDFIYYTIDASRNDEARAAAENSIHYIHGLNPLNLVYLSNMYIAGGDNCVNEFYHTWFTNGSAKWDRVGKSTYGPPPGFLTGGANPGYNWDAIACPSNPACNAESITPPKGQPQQKSYKDFNTSWPINSWEVTENSDAYQVNYIRLLSKFIQAGYDCSGTAGGTAAFDACHRCAGGTTGITPSTSNTNCIEKVVTGIAEEEVSNFEIYPNPTQGTIHIETKKPGAYTLSVVGTLGNKILSSSHIGSTVIDVRNQPAGLLVVIIDQDNQRQVKKIVKF